jgi:hypothetical protein
MSDLWRWLTTAQLSIAQVVLALLILATARLLILAVMQAVAGRHSRKKSQ